RTFLPPPAGRAHSRRARRCRRHKCRYQRASKPRPLPSASREYAWRRSSKPSIFEFGGGGDNFAERNILGARGRARGGFVRREFLRVPQLKRFPAADKRDFIADADGSRQIMRQADAAFAVERQLD